MRVLLVTVGNNANDSCKMPLRNSSYPVQMLTIRHARIYFRRDRGNVFTDVYDTIRYETTGFFSVRSEAATSQLNLPHGTKN